MRVGIPKNDLLKPSKRSVLKESLLYLPKVCSKLCDLDTYKCYVFMQYQVQYETKESLKKISVGLTLH